MLLQICESNVPVKKAAAGKPKILNALRRKKNRLKARLNAIERSTNCNPFLVHQIQNKIADLCYDIKEAIRNDLNQKERNAVSKIKESPKFFYSYAP